MTPIPAGAMRASCTIVSLVRPSQKPSSAPPPTVANGSTATVACTGTASPADRSLRGPPCTGATNR
jgi:hypothetical protein